MSTCLNVDRAAPVATTVQSSRPWLCSDLQHPPSDDPLGRGTPPAPSDKHDSPQTPLPQHVNGQPYKKTNSAKDHANVPSDVARLHYDVQHSEPLLSVEAQADSQFSTLERELSRDANDIQTRLTPSVDEPSLLDGIDAMLKEDHLPAPAPRPPARITSVDVANVLLDAVHSRLKKPKELTETQMKAIELFLAGKTDAQVAEELDVHRTTLWRWRRKDEDFRGRLAYYRERALRDSSGRLRELVPNALEVLQAQLAEGNLQAAVQVLRLARIDQTPPADRNSGLFPNSRSPIDP